MCDVQCMYTHLSQARALVRHPPLVCLDKRATLSQGKWNCFEDTLVGSVRLLATQHRVQPILNVSVSQLRVLVGVCVVESLLGLGFNVMGI